MLQRTRLKNLWLLLAGVFFFLWGSPSGIWILAAAVAGNYLIARYMRRNSVTAAVVLDIGLIVCCRYAGVLQLQPVGLSFFALQLLSYVIDVKRGAYAAEKDLLKLSVYTVFHPKLASGPLASYGEFSRQLDICRMDAGSLAQGFSRLITGLAKKVLLADTLAKIAGAAFACPDVQRGAPLAWIGMAACTLQVYFDLTGYTDMAIGLARMLGISLPENFLHPLSALSMRTFWRRWHVTLSSWFRQYIYVPLGGNRAGQARSTLNILVIFLLTGLWHGATLPFIVWGLWNALFVALEHAGVWRPENWSRAFARLYTWLVVMLGFIFFRAGSLAQATAYAGSLFNLGAEYTGMQRFVEQLTPVNLLALACGYAAVFLKIKVCPYIRGFLLLVLLGICCLAIAAGGFRPFIYAQF